jgi:tetratricopeptide (TPR) repeat protein
MNSRGSRLTGAMLAVLLAALLSAPVHIGDKQFTLADAVPDDVFVYTAVRHNPERGFLDRYWGEVFDALAQCGVGEDLLDLVSSLLGAEHKDEVARLKERASQLLAGVDWGQLAAKEMVFAERLPPPMRISPRGIVMPPNWIWLFRGSGEGPAQNFEGLAAILEGVAEETNKALGAEALVVDRTSPMGAKVASVNLLAMVPGAPPFLISVALRDDVVIVALGEEILNDVLGLLDGSASKRALADDPRFKAAFAQLPPAEDSMVFFDMQALLKPIRTLVDLAAAEIGAPGDVYRRTGMNSEANRLTGQALEAYGRGDIKEALRLTQQAYDSTPNDSIVLYNLACFHALLGHQDEALSWLEQAVEGGFYAPGKIASDPDLNSLRDEPRYKATLAKATELAAECCAEDIVVNSSKRGEAYKLSQQAWEVYKQQDYEQGLKLVEQAYAVAPNDSRVLYYLACFHALLGHNDKALDFLERAVDGGFYCPQHISKDPDLESIRSNERYEAALAEAKKKAAEKKTEQATGKLTIVKRVVDRLMDAAGVLDYVATIETTDGYSVRTESIAVLVPDAEDRPIYPVFGKRRQLTEFDRYLPQETLSFSISDGFDPAELYQFLEDTFRTAGPTGEELLAKWAQLQAKLGLDVKKDIIGWIDGGYVSVSLEDDKGSVWLIKVTDEEVARQKVTDAIEFLSAKLTEAAGKIPILAAAAVLAPTTSPTQHEQLEGFQNLLFAFSPQPVVWGVADGRLIVGTSADAVAVCLATARGEHPSIRENPRAMGEAIVPTGPFTSVKLTDQRKLGDNLASGIQIAATISGMLTMGIPDAKARQVVSRITAMLRKLTPVVRKIDFYKSTATHTTFDGRAWHTRTVTHYVSPAERAASVPQ